MNFVITLIKKDETRRISLHLHDIYNSFQKETFKQNLT